MNKHWLSCSKFTVEVVTKRNAKGVDIVVAPVAPIVAKFKGQSLCSLVAWARKFGELKLRRL